MRKIYFALLAAIVFAGTAIAQDKKPEKIEGSGKLITREVAVSSFDVLEASGVYELKLSQAIKKR